MAIIIDGKKLAEEIKEKIKKEVADLKKKGAVPSLASIIIGNNPASKLYVKLKEKACNEVGIYSEKYSLDENTSEEEIIKLIHKLNKNPKINGILVQLPFPKCLNQENILEAIDPRKDVDGLTSTNLGNLLIGNEFLVPCTPKGVIRLLESINIEIEGKDVVIINHSNVVGKPLAMMFLNRNATVSVCHVKTKDLKKYTSKADILISGTGVKNLIKEDMVKENSIVIDVGISKEGNKIYGDVDFENVKNKVYAITPVPGGVGPMTIAMLLENTIKAAKIQNN